MILNQHPNGTPRFAKPRVYQIIDRFGGELFTKGMLNAIFDSDWYSIYAHQVLFMRGIEERMVENRKWDGLSRRTKSVVINPLNIFDYVQYATKSKDVVKMLVKSQPVVNESSNVGNMAIITQENYKGSQIHRSSMSDYLWFSRTTFDVEDESLGAWLYDFSKRYVVDHYRITSSGLTSKVRVEVVSDDVVENTTALYHDTIPRVDQNFYWCMVEETNSVDITIKDITKRTNMFGWWYMKNIVDWDKVPDSATKLVLRKMLGTISEFGERCEPMTWRRVDYDHWGLSESEEDDDGLYPIGEGGAPESICLSSKELTAYFRGKYDLIVKPFGYNWKVTKGVYNV